MQLNSIIALFGFIALVIPSASFADEIMDCLLEPNKRIEVSSPVQGVLKQVYVIRGDKVSKGQKLFELRAELEDAELNLARARAEFSARTLIRNEHLYQQELLSIHEKDEFETDARLAQLSLEEAKVRLQMKRIYSPVDGFVIETMKAEGEFVDERPILILASIDPLYVEVVAPIDYLRRVSKGMTATVTPEAPLNSPHTASVIIVDPIVDAASGTIRIRLEMDNTDLTIPSGLKCAVKF